MLACDLHSDGRLGELLYVDGGVSASQSSGKLRMSGREVFRHAVEKLADTAHAALARAGLGAGDVDWIVPHQANIRIIEATAKRMGVGMERVVVTVQDHGNTSAASIPLAMSVAASEGRLAPRPAGGGRGDRRRAGLGVGGPALVSGRPNQAESGRSAR